MLSIEEYKQDPCGSLSIPYWKAKHISIPSHMRIVHDRDFSEEQFEGYSDEKYFRLKHTLTDIPGSDPSAVRIGPIPPERFDELRDTINRSYVHSDIVVTADQLRSWTATEVYCPDLWLGAFLDGRLIGSVICDFDREVGEAVVEWLQILPEYRGKGIATALLSKALNVMKAFADFATVSGACENVTQPEKVYRRCGFTGNDLWHVLTEEGPADR